MNCPCTYSLVYSQHTTTATTAATQRACKPDRQGHERAAQQRQQEAEGAVATAQAAAELTAMTTGATSPGESGPGATEREEKWKSACRKLKDELSERDRGLVLRDQELAKRSKVDDLTRSDLT